MDEKDLFIKQKLQKDQLISKKADDVFNNFLKGELKMEKEKAESKIEQKTTPKKVPMMKRLLATAASFVIVFGMANVYATTNGYGNVFFMIKYLVTGDGTVITDKGEILSDRDISISYEPIRLTENIRMQIRNLQVKDNKAQLNLAIDETKLEEDSSIVPLKYKVYNSANELLCEQRSSKEKGYNGYGEELLLNNFKENDEIIVLEVYKANDSKIAKITINLQSRNITVEGEKEALKKVSEIELKKYLSIVSTYDGEPKNEDGKINYATEIFNEIKDKDEKRVDEINNMLESLGCERVSDSFKQSDDYKVVTKNGVDYFEVISGWDYSPNTILDITDMSFVDGLYDATFTYISVQEADSFDTDYSNIEKHEATVCFRVNKDDTYSRFKFLKYESFSDYDETYNPYQIDNAEEDDDYKYTENDDEYVEISINNDIEKVKLNDYIGDWYESSIHYNDTNPNNLIIKNVENNKLIMDLYITRTAYFDNFESAIDGNKGTFVAFADADIEESTDNKTPKISGKIELSNNTVMLRILESNVRFLEADSEYIFTYKTDIINEEETVIITPKYPEITEELDEGYVFELENVRDNYNGTYTLQGKLLKEDKSRVAVNTLNGFNTLYYEETGENRQITLSEEATYYEYSNNHGHGMVSKVGWFFSNPLLSGKLDTTKVGYTFQFENGSCISMTGEEILK